MPNSSYSASRPYGVRTRESRLERTVAYASALRTLHHQYSVLVPGFEPGISCLRGRYLDRLATRAWYSARESNPALRA